MKNLKCLSTMLCMVLAISSFNLLVSAQSTDDGKKLGTISGGGSNVTWDVAIPHSGLTLTIAAPDGRVFRKEFRAGSSAEFSITDKQGERLPDGQYSYELRVAPLITAGAREKLADARGKDDEPEDVRATRKRFRKYLP